MAGQDNLIPQSERTKEEQREIARMGGKASGKARRQKKLMKETLEVLLSMPIQKGREVDIESVKSFAEIKGKNINVQEAMLISMIQKALKGNVYAAEWVRDTVGENPVNKIEADMDMELNINIDYGEDDG